MCENPVFSETKVTGCVFVGLHITSNYRPDSYRALCALEVKFLKTILIY